MTLKVGFCGIGNMGKAILNGILKSGMVLSDNVTVYDVHTPAVESAARDLGVKTAPDEAGVAENVDVIILAVKPDTILTVLDRIKNALGSRTIVVSIAAGITMKQLEDHLKPDSKIARVMPNTPALVREGMSAIIPNASLTEEDKKTVMSIFRSIGKAEIITENVMDAVLGVSGSAPAYVYMFIEALADGAVLCGMPRQLAYEFAAQTVYGSALMVMNTGRHPGDLKDMVCSPAGTTIEAVKVLEEHGFRSAVINAVAAAAEKNRNM